MLFLSERSGQVNATFIGLLTPIRKYIVAILAVNIGSLSSAVFWFGLCVEGVFQAFKSFLLEKRKTLGLPLASHLHCQWFKGPVLTTLWTRFYVLTAHLQKITDRNEETRFLKTISSWFTSSLYFFQLTIRRSCGSLNVDSNRFDSFCIPSLDNCIFLHWFTNHLYDNEPQISKGC